VNLSHVPDRTTEEVRVVVEREVQKITNASILQGVQTFLVTPRVEMRTWGWEKTPADYPVWIIAESSRYGYGIAFSETCFPFAPEFRCGLLLVFLLGRCVQRLMTA
jgi:hypothetical protein